MISESSNSLVFSSMSMTKNKRDEFLVEIRKKKSQMIILKKRMKLYGNSIDRPTSMQEEIFGYPENNPGIEEEIILSEEVKSKLIEAEKLFYHHLYQGNFEDLINVIAFLRESISEKSSIPGKVIIEMGIVPSLLKFLSEQYTKETELQVHVAWLLANISAGSSQETMYLVQQDIIPVLSKILRITNNEDLHENAMWCLANICGENNLDLRDQIIEEGVLNHVVRELCKTPKKVLYYRTAAWLISNLVRGPPYPSFDKVEKCFSALTHLIDYNDATIQQHTLLSLVYLSDEARTDNLKGIIDNSLIPKILTHIGNEDDKIATNALKVTGNIAKGDKLLTHNLCGHEMFKSMPRALKSQNPLLKKEACVTLFNVFEQDFEDHDYVTDFEILPVLIDIASKDQDEIKAHATKCLHKFFLNCPHENAETAIEKGVLEIFFQNLQSRDSNLITHSLAALYAILGHGNKMKQSEFDPNPLVVLIIQNNCLQIIENLFNHQDESIRCNVEVLLNNFFANYDQRI